MKSILEYLNYREYLKDWIKYQKSEGRPGSNRWFAQKMGINSSSWLSSVLAGVRNLNTTHQEQLAKILKLSAREQQYFLSLVAFNQSKEREKQNLHFKKIKKLQDTSESHTVSVQCYEYYTDWYHSAIRALVGIMEIGDNYEDLVPLLTPKISLSKISESLKLLESMELIHRNSDGVFELTKVGITTGGYDRSVAVREFHEETLNLARQAVVRGDKNEKDISTLTLGISRSNITAVKEILSQARRDIAEFADTDDDADSVYQLNMQLFPLSKPIVSKHKKIKRGM